MRVFLIAAFLFLIPHVASAQGLFKERSQAPLELLDATKIPKTVTDFSNLYFMGCMDSNRIPELRQYMVTQCACTAANMQKHMSFEQASRLFSSRTRDNYYYSRFMTLAYIPCLRYSVDDLAHDLCRKAERNSPARQCSCVGEGVSKQASSVGAISLIPGYTGGGFNLNETVDNPFPDVVTSDNIRVTQDHYMSACKNPHLKP